jgi:sugar phosphate isomerase/epimerase
VKISYSFFPKMFASMEPAELADFARDAGLDTVNAVIRDGYWIFPDNVPADAAGFAKAMRVAGMPVHFATTCWNPAGLLARSDRADVLSGLRDAGIRDVRLTQYFSGGKYGAVGDVPAELESARADFRRLEELARETGVRFIYQVHHMTLISSASSLHALIGGLDPRYVAAMLDGGNQQMEGYEKWLKASRLFGSQLVAFGIKDVAWKRTDPTDGGAMPADPAKGWKARFVPIYEGVTNWSDVIGALADIDFEGTFVFMPFYGVEDRRELLSIVRREVAYLRSLENGGSS